MCVIKEPFPIGSEANLRVLNEDRRCHRQTEKPTVTHSSSPVCQVEGPFNTVLHTPVFDGTGNNSNPKPDLGFKRLVCTFINVPPKFSVKLSCECFLTDVMLIENTLFIL